jgi:hypothetical protein
MMRYFLISLFGLYPAMAGLPPTSTKGSGDANPVTTFQINMPSVPLTHSGTIATMGTLAVGGGGTGQTTYTNGQLLIGNSATGSLSKATLTAGSNITITNGNGSITVAASGSSNQFIAVDSNQYRFVAARLAAQSGGSCAIQTNGEIGGDWINGTPSSSGTGLCSISINASVFTNIPSCVCVAEQASSISCSQSTLPTTSTVVTRTSNTTTGAAINSEVTVMCMGQI